MKQLRIVGLWAVLVGEISAFALPGQLDATFTNQNLQNSANTLLPLADGRVLVGFNNTSPVFNGTNVGSVIRLTAGGALDATFSCSDTNRYGISTLAVLSGGNVLVNGSFTNWAGTGRKYLVKLDSNGAVQPGFTSGVNSTAKLFLAEQPDGKIIVVGNSLTTTNGTSLSPLQRLLADGSLDTNFFTTNIFVPNQILSFDLVPDGTGRFFVSLVNPNTFQHQIVRFNANGTLDGSFLTGTLGSAVDSTVQMVKALPNGGVMLCGYFLSSYSNMLGSVSVGHLLRVNPDGSVDTSFAFTDTRYVVAFTVQSDGKAIVPNGSSLGVDRFDVNGTLSADWTRMANYALSTPYIDNADHVLFFSTTYKTGDSITARVGSVTVDSNNVAVVNGMFYTNSFIGTNYFNQSGSQTNNFYTARYGTNGIGVGVVVNGTSSSAVAYGFKVSAYFSAGNRRGDIYVAGYPAVTVGATNLTGTNVFLAKLNAPGLAPYVLVQPNASYTSTSLSTFQLTTTTGGQAPLTYQWRNNGVPIPAATNATLAFAAPLPTDNGSYDCIIANAYGTTATVASQVTFTPPFSIYRQPNSVGLVFGTNTVSGSDIVAGFLDPNAMIGRNFNCYITNGSGMWPATANFSFNLPSASAYNIPSGTLGNHSGSWGLQVALPTQTILSLYYWSTSPSNIPSSIAFHTGGGFDIHHDISDPAGCCANGYFTIGASANSNAIFSAASTGSVIPTIQWYRNGILLVGQTNTTLSYVPAGYAQVGTYTATFTYSNYVVTTAPSTLIIYPPAIGYTYVPGNSTMDFNIPPGYVLQSSTTLAPPSWTTISTNSTFTVPVNQPGAYFRIVP